MKDKIQTCVVEKKEGGREYFIARRTKRGGRNIYFIHDIRYAKKFRNEEDAKNIIINLREPERFSIRAV